MKHHAELCETCGQYRGGGALRSEVPAAGDPIDNGLLLTGRMMHVSRLATIGEMASGVAHELNQPLAAIANYAQASARLLNSPNPDLADVREALQEIGAQAVRAGEIIRRMRGLVREDEAERAPASANALIGEMVDLLQADARTHDIQLRVSLAPDLPTILVHKVQVQHVILNLVRNAMEALVSIPPAQREIVVGTARGPDDTVEIFVSDNGPGVPHAVKERWLEPFFTTKTNGTGLGLAISNTIARAHDGSFGYRPNTPSGACFYVRLPVASGAS